MKLNPSDIQIPPLPSVALQVLHFDTHNPDASIEDMVGIVSPDKAICSEILRISNSAFYGRSGRIKSLHDAITLMGLKSVKNIVILHHSRLLSTTACSSFMNRITNEMPVATALIAVDLARPLRLSSILDQAFIAGLLHSIGNVVIALARKKEYEQLLETYESSGGDLFALEQEAFGTDHLELGLVAFEKWRLPEDYLAVIRSFRTISEKMDLAGLSDLSRITMLASLIARRLLGLRRREFEESLEKRLFQSFGADERIMAHFNEEYFTNLKDHPFYERVAPS